VTALLQISKAKMVSTVLLSMIRCHSDFQKPALRCFHWQPPVPRQKLSKAKIGSLKMGADPALLGGLRGLVYAIVGGLVSAWLNEHEWEKFELAARSR